ncbi:Inositol-phosphate phosphatase (plasmid) [Neorhizobium galegae bv. officinalis bv. officinalis str. HAMBI 1141]|uniref:Inositol-phosphate phosphatase n=1 Tax=Neorhizobium galegae bv. officinalis bv. officinalis str. HAMBI 1141 TaxID=1028801 RepID=A0A068THQ9_NEOGA|nr:inositol monophosphatase family protein [Neorhizobium galegae]CDN57654.1 Inositol-phosphate phosphatase [Neorhizobium galegae bv. officinalis bv. officinalis str. HAMBI 1141]
MRAHALTDRLATLHAVISEVAAFTLERFHDRDGWTAETKGPSDYVSAVDRDAETLARRLLADSGPDDLVVGEEQGGNATGSYWLIDPVDGTANFISGIPIWSVSIAYVAAGTPVLGAVALPALETLVWATSDGSLNVDGPLQMIGANASAAFGIGRNREWPTAHRVKIEGEIEAAGYHVVSLGSCAASLALVATGRLAGYIEHGTNLWDCAAGHVLCLAASKPSLIVPDHADQKVSIIAGAELRPVDLSMP